MSLAAAPSPSPFTVTEFPKSRTGNQAAIEAFAIALLAEGRAVEAFPDFRIAADGTAQPFVRVEMGGVVWTLAPASVECGIGFASRLRSEARRPLMVAANCLLLEAAAVGAKIRAFRQTGKIA